MVEFVSGLIEQLGYLGIALLMFVETLIPPIPSELIMPLVGVAAAKGHVSLIGATAAAVAGATLGATAWYLAARAFGPARLVALADRHGRWIGLNGSIIRRPAIWFARRGGLTVFLARILPGMRVYISIPAGLVGMSLPRFLSFTVAGFAVWYGMLGGVGYALGLNVHALIDATSRSAPWLLGLLGLFVLWRLASMRRVSETTS